MARKHDESEDQESQAFGRSEAVAGSGAKEPAPQEVDRAVTHVSETVSSNVPQEALQAGEFELPENHNLRLMKNNKIPDGSYRVTGHEWILDFADGHLIKITRGSPDSEPSSYTSIPQPREGEGLERQQRT